MSFTKLMITVVAEEEVALVAVEEEEEGGGMQSRHHLVVADKLDSVSRLLAHLLQLLRDFRDCQPRSRHNGDVSHWWGWSSTLVREGWMVTLR